MRNIWKIVISFVSTVFLTSCLNPEDITPYSECYLEVNNGKYMFTEIVEPHKDEFGLDYQFQNLELLPIQDEQNYKVAIDLITSTKYMPLTEKLSSKVFKPINNNGIARQIIDDANIVFEITVSPTYFHEIADGDCYCAYVVIENNNAYLAVYRIIQGENFVTIYQAINSKPIIKLSNEIDQLCENSVNTTE